jgi:hypothetical protein
VLQLRSTSYIPSYALVIGYNDSKTLPSLYAGVSDAEEMSQLLIKCGFKVTTLTNEQATRAKVSDEKLKILIG